MLDYLTEHSLLVEGAPLLVMLSGGGDSVALLHLLATAGECVQSEKISVLHINHLLRGADSDGDEAFVRELCEGLSVPCEIRRLDVAAYAAEQGGLNLEDAGRILRYQEADKLLDQLCDEARVSREDGRIATAHTRDDRVETFFMRAIYGSGTGALAGIAPKRQRIIRPLLDIDRAELRNWLEENAHSWREDKSNEDMRRTRAFIRAKIVPEAEKLRPNFRENLARTMDLIADDDRLLTNMAKQFARDFCVEREAEETVALDARLLLTLDRVMMRRVIRTAITETFADASRLESSHLEAIVAGMDALRKELLKDADVSTQGKKLVFTRDIPPALRVKLNYDTLVVARISRLEDRKV